MEVMTGGSDLISGKVVAITGASSGIGAEMCQLFAEQGANVIAMARSQNKLNALRDRIGERVVPCKLDVTSSAEVEAAFADIRAKYGRVDILVNNAGFGYFKPFTETSEEEVEQMMNVNYFGLVRCTKAVLPMMEAQGGGHIINIASMAGKVATAKAGPYAATKYAVLGLSAALRQEWASKGVMVSTVNPGPVRTPFLEGADPSGRYVQNLPSGMMLDARQVAQAVVTVARKRKREVNLPAWLGWAAKLYSLFPGWSERIASGLINRK